MIEVSNLLVHRSLRGFGGQLRQRRTYDTKNFASFAAAHEAAKVPAKSFRGFFGAKSTRVPLHFTLAAKSLQFSRR